MSLPEGVTVEEGRYYRRRDGVVVGPMSVSDSASFPWRAPNSETYMSDGRWCETWADEWDLVAPEPDPRQFTLKLHSAPTAGIGDINSDTKGSGARFNAGKMRVDLIPFEVISTYEDMQFEGELTPELDEALAVLRSLGAWQARRCGASAVLERMDDPWSSCAAVFDYGAKKYAAWNWAKGMPWSVPAACAVRHLLAILRGEANDPESGLPHIGHVACNLVMLAQYENTYREGDDRPSQLFALAQAA